MTFIKNNFQSQAILIKIPISFTESEKPTLKFIWNHRAKTILGAWGKVQMITMSALKTILQSHSNKNSMVLAQR